jgi:hypothetical protein
VRIAVAEGGKVKQAMALPLDAFAFTDVFGD